MNWNVRGRYEGGGMIVTAKHWWSPKERKSARLAAVLLAHEAPRLHAEVVKHATNYLIYGEGRLTHVAHRGDFPSRL